MRRATHVLSSAVLVATALVTVPTAAQAVALDTTCTYSSATHQVTLTLPGGDANEGPVRFGRIQGSARLGFYTWSQSGGKVCGAASTSNTDRVKVVGSDQSEELWITLENGALAPGRQHERSGVSEIEIVGDLGGGTDELRLVGSDGADHLVVATRRTSMLNADSDADVTLESVEQWALDGGLGGDALDAHGAGLLRVWGREGADRIIGSPGDDDLYGDEGTSPAGDGADTILAGNGSDYVRGGGGADHLSGGDGNDTLVPEKAEDVVSGGAGNDWFAMGAAADGGDALSGGSGRDTLWFADRSKGVHVTMDGRANDGAVGEHDLVRGDFEKLVGGAGPDLLVGSNTDNYLVGNDGNDVLNGLGGDDAFDGGDGDDTINGGDGDDDSGNSAGHDTHLGGAGDDYFSAGSTADGRDVYSGGTGNDTLSYGSRTFDVIVNVRVDNGDGEVTENDSVKPDFEAVYGGAASDTLVGGPLSEYINGGTGDDVLDGGAGADSLDGGIGSDDLTGGDGDDIVAGNADDDVLHVNDGGHDYAYCGAGANDTVVTDGYDTLADCEVVS